LVYLRAGHKENYAGYRPGKSDFWQIDNNGSLDERIKNAMRHFP
jgi:hypothetical protein